MPSPDPFDGDAETVRIHYLRPPDRLEIFVQQLLQDTPEVKVTLASPVPLERPLWIGGEVVLEAGSDAVWFTFPGAWHDIGRFHRADGTFTGIYANVLTPCRFLPGRHWETTDLFLDLWIPATHFDAGWRGDPLLLDEEELSLAESRGWVAPDTSSRAREEARALTAAARTGHWPPPVVHAWPLATAREVRGRAPISPRWRPE